MPLDFIIVSMLKAGVGVNKEPNLQNKVRDRSQTWR